MTAIEPRPAVEDGPVAAAVSAPPRWLVRGRLLEALDGSIECGLALVVAPVGSGKTTLLQQWAACRTGPLRWVAPSDASIDRLTHESLEGTAVLLDDAHLLGRRATSALTRQIEQTTPGTTYVIAARSIPQFNLAHCEFPVPVLITQDDLRFGPGEIADLFGQVYRAPLSRAIARDLAVATDGWAAALYLQHFSERSSLGRARSAVEGPRQSILLDRAYTWEYLTQEVLTPLPPPLLHFLEVTCVLEPVSVRACDLLLAWDGSRKALRELTARSGLVRADPVVDGDFHYHPVLRAHLGARLNEIVGTVRAQELHQRARDIRTLLSCVPTPPNGPGVEPPAVGARRPVGWEDVPEVDQLDVRCLGGFRFRWRGVELDQSVRPSARTVLRILAVRAGTPVHREELVQLFWPDHSLESGIHNLHVAISALRRCLDVVGPGRGRDLLARRGDAYVLAPDGELVTDLQRLDQAIQAAASATTQGDAVARLAALRQALRLYAGDVLPAEGPAEWVVEIREQVRQRVAQAATELSRDELAGGDIAAARTAATRSVTLDAWNDEAWRQLIDCHVAAGDHAQAARARLAYHRRLRDLGVETNNALGPAARAGLRFS